MKDPWKSGCLSCRAARLKSWRPRFKSVVRPSRSRGEEGRRFESGRGGLCWARDGRRARARAPARVEKKVAGETARTQGTATSEGWPRSRSASTERRLSRVCGTLTLGLTRTLRGENQGSPWTSGKLPCAGLFGSAPGEIRTPDLRFRRPSQRLRTSAGVRCLSC
jgi:hypothetical protein